MTDSERLKSLKATLLLGLHRLQFDIEYTVAKFEANDLTGAVAAISDLEVGSSFFKDSLIALESMEHRDICDIGLNCEFTVVSANEEFIQALRDNNLYFT